MSQLLSDRSEMDRPGMDALPSQLSSVAGDEMTHGAAAPGNERVRVIWGTNIIIADAISSFRSFLANFTLAQRKRFETSGPNMPLPRIVATDLDPLYPRLLGQVLCAGWP